MPVTRTRKETVKTTKAVKTAEAVETAEVGKNGNESESEYPNLAQVPCIQYPITFRKMSMPMSALFDSGSKVNAIHPTFTREPGLPIKTTNVEAQKIDGTILNTFKMVVGAFSMTDKANQVKFFEETFLVTNVHPEVVLGMPILILSGANVDFLVRELW